MGTYFSLLCWMIVSMSPDEIEWIRITPIEYYRKGGLIRRYYKRGPRYVSEKLDLEILNTIIQRMRRHYSIQEDPKIAEIGSFIVYQYPDKPLVAIDREDGNFYTTRETLEDFDIKEVRHQASILLRILLSFKFFNPTMKRVSIKLHKFSPRR